MNKRSQLLLLVLLSLLLFFPRLGAESVFQVAEARNATCAREMLDAGNWVVPMFNGTLRTDKPALEYFLMMTAYQVGGVSEGAARFFSALCGLLLIIFTYLTAFKYLGKRAAWWSALVMLASTHLVFQMRLATPDPYLILLDTLALFSFLEGWTGYQGGKGNWRWYAGMYLLLGLAFLAKGPVGIFLPALVILLFLLIKKQFTWRNIVRLQPWWGLLLILLCSAPWYLLVHLRTKGNWTKQFFLEHNLHRFGDAMGGHGGIFLITFAFVIAGMLPFSTFIVHATGLAWKKRKDNDLLLLSLITLATVTVFYAVSRTKLINYTVPCYPFLALVTGYFLSGLISRPRLSGGIKVPFLLLGIIGTLIPAGVYLFTQTTEPLHGFGWISLCFILYPIGCWTAYIFAGRLKIAKGLSVLVITFVAETAILFMVPYPVVDQVTAIRKAQPLFEEGHPVAAYRQFNDAFVFYIGHPIPVLEDTNAVKQFLRTNPDALIITADKHPEPLEQIQGLEEIRHDRELFSTHPSRVYRYRSPSISEKTPRQ